MDAQADWAASALFSPSKARVQQAQAKDWAAVEAWLSRRYGAKRPPAFEKTEETLQALLTLANINDSADEQRNQLERIEKTALHSLSKRTSGLAHDVLQAILSQLDADERLDTLAELLVALDSKNTDAVEVGKDIIRLTSAEFEGKQRLMRASAQLAALKRESSLLNGTIHDLKSERFQAPSDVVESTNEWTKSAKHLKAKIAEYDERIAAVRPKTASSSIELIQQKTADIERQREALELFCSRLDAVQDLPPDARAAREKIENAREQLRKLATKRDELFENLVAG